MFNKVEIIGSIVAVLAMVVVLYLIQDRLTPSAASLESQTSQAVASDIIIVDETIESEMKALQAAIMEAVDVNGNILRMIIDDIKIGTGSEVVEGDTVTVHYAGSLQNGPEFDNSRNRGEPFEFTVGGGQVIKGWEEGLLGMKEGGERILVIPPDKGYGEQGIGPIPGGATLVFKIELLEIK